MPMTSFNKELPLLLVEVILEKETIRNLTMALDTGASQTIISFEVATAIGADPAVSTKRTRIVTGSGMEISPLVTVSRVKALGKEVKNLDIACHSLPVEGFVDGLLGLDFLKKFRLVIDFRNGKIEIS